MPERHVTPAAEAPNRRERKLQETRRSILSAAQTLFESVGYAETTVEQIAAAADVAPRTFFRYFPTKESLLFAELDEARRAMLDALETSPEDEDPIVSLSRVLAEHATELERRRDELAWGFRICRENDVDGVYERSMIKEHTYARIAGFIAERLGVDPNEDARPLAWTMAAMGVFGASMRVGATAKEDSSLDAVDRFDETLRSTAEALHTCAEARARES